MQPRVLRRRADGQTAGRPPRRDAAGARPHDRHRRLDLALRPGRPGRSSGRPTSPAGTTRAGSTPRGCGPAGTSSTTPSTTIALDPWDERLQRRPRPPKKRWRRRSPPGARPALRDEHRAELLDFAQPRRAADRRQLAERPLPGDAPERAAAADRHQPRPDPPMSRGDTTAATTTRARSSCARPPPKRARACRRSSRGCPSPAGTGLSRRTLPLPQRRPGARRLRRLEAPARRLRGRDRPGGAERQDPGLGLLRRRRRRDERARPGRRPALRALRPNLALAKATAPPSPRTRGCSWHPAAAGLATLHAEGKVSAFPAIGYDHPDQSHFTSRHYYEIGELEVGFRTGWMGRYIDLVGDDDNPLQGLSMDGSLSPMIATAEKPVAAIDSVDGYDLWTRVGEPIERRDVQRSFASFGSLPSDSRGLAQVRRATAQTDQLRRTRRRRRLHQPGRLSRTTTSPTSSPGSPPTSPPACRCGW